MSSQPAINLSAAAWPGLRHMDAAARASGYFGEVSEPGLGVLSHAHVQLVPQSRGILSLDVAQEIRDTFAKKQQTQFRLHANVRVLDSFLITDLSTVGKGTDHTEWFAQARRVHEALGADVYSAHAGRRANATLDEVFDNARSLTQSWGCPVAVEGLYPTRTNEYLLASWQEYARLLDAQAYYALDLSHLNIVLFNRRPNSNEDEMNRSALRRIQGQVKSPSRMPRADSSGGMDWVPTESSVGCESQIGGHAALLQELLSSPYCVEIHVSANDGSADQHGVLQSQPWWWSWLVQCANPKAQVFSEGNQLRREREQ